MHWLLYVEEIETREAFVAFLRRRRAEILEAWERRVRALPPARTLDRQALIDHMPVILDDLAEAAEAALAGRAMPELKDDPDRHAIVRLHQGYDLGHVVSEYSLLRETIQDLAVAQDIAYPEELRVFNRVLDGAIEHAAHRYATASQRMLEALDRISLLAFTQQPLQSVLHELLEVMMRAAPAVDEVTVLLKEGDRLYVREAVGITIERDRGFSIPVGEGFAGTIAARREPLFLRSAATDPLMRSQFLRERGLKAIYGVPLIDGTDVIGVAHMGSLTAFEFVDEDMLLFRAMANRASQLIIEARLKEELRARHDELELAMAAADLGAWRWRVSEREIDWDARTRALFGVGADEPITFEGFLALIAPEDRARVSEAIERAVSSAGAGRGEYRVRYRVLRPDGQERHVEARGGTVREGDETRFLGIVQDRTEEVYAERERALFLAALGHDLRTPLHAISLASSKLIRDGALPEGAAIAVGRMARSSERMARLIEQLLDFARARAGQPLALERRPVNLVELWRQAIDEAALLAPDRRIELEPRGDPFGEWDADRMLQLAHNLLLNAIQYGDPARPITVSLSGDEETAIVEVHNFGAPIPPELMPALFDPFRRGRRGRGLGLGLYISMQIVAAHGGRIEARSTAEEGTTFRVALPRRG